MSNYTREDLQILLRIIGSRKGADVEEIAAFQKSHRWPQRSADEIESVIERFTNLGYVARQDSKFVASPALHTAFNEACRNCQDTIEEYDVLLRILEANPRLPR